MSELITEKELLELGFTKSLYSETKYRFMYENFLIQVTLINKNATLFINHTNSIKKTCTKNNVLKLIEIAKLIGELE